MKTTRNRRCTHRLLVVFLLVWIGHFVPATHAATPDSREPGGYKSGYGSLPRFGGPEGVTQQLKQGDEDKQATVKLDAIQRGLKPYFDWKRRLENEHGFAFGLQGYWL